MEQPEKGYKEHSVLLLGQKKNFEQSQINQSSLQTPTTCSLLAHFMVSVDPNMVSTERIRRDYAYHNTSLCTTVHRSSMTLLIDVFSEQV